MLLSVQLLDGATAILCWLCRGVQLPCGVIARAGSKEGEEEEEGTPRPRAYSVSAFLQRYVARVHAPMLVRPSVQALVLALFAGAFLLSLAALPRLSKCASASAPCMPSCRPLADPVGALCSSHSAQPCCMCTLCLCTWHLRTQMLARGLREAVGAC